MNMNEVIERFWPKSSVPEAPQESLSQRIERQKTEMLLAGGGSLGELSNVAAGTPGHALHSLERDGLMSCEMKVTDTGLNWTYTLTEAGAEAQKMLQPDAA